MKKCFQGGTWLLRVCLPTSSWAGAGCRAAACPRRGRGGRRGRAASRAGTACGRSGPAAAGSAWSAWRCDPSSRTLSSASPEPPSPRSGSAARSRTAARTRPRTRRWASWRRGPRAGPGRARGCGCSCPPPCLTPCRPRSPRRCQSPWAPAWRRPRRWRPPGPGPRRPGLGTSCRWRLRSTSGGGHICNMVPRLAGISHITPHIDIYNIPNWVIYTVFTIVMSSYKSAFRARS